MRIKMVNSAGEYVAGEEYDLDDEVSDRFLAAGYAEGDVAGDYSIEEWEALVSEQQALHQTVGV